jgi:hypothetical protein
MTREEFAKKIRWDFVMWVIGYANPLLALPQLIKLVQTGDASGVSGTFLGFLLVIQIGFASHDFFQRDRMLSISNALAACLTFITTSLAFYFGAGW